MNLDDREFIGIDLRKNPFKPEPVKIENPYRIFPSYRTGGRVFPPDEDKSQSRSYLLKPSHSLRQLYSLSETFIELKGGIRT